MAFSTISVKDLVGSVRGYGSPLTNQQLVSVGGTSMTQEAIDTINEMAIAADSGDGSNGGRKPPKAGTPWAPFFKMPYEGNPDSLLNNLKGMYNVLDHDVTALKFDVSNNGNVWTDEQAKRLSFDRTKMMDILRCVWALEGEKH